MLISSRSIRAARPGDQDKGSTPCGAERLSRASRSTFRNSFIHFASSSGLPVRYALADEAHGARPGR